MVDGDDTCVNAYLIVLHRTMYYGFRLPNTSPNTHNSHALTDQSQLPVHQHED